MSKNLLLGSLILASATGCSSMNNTEKGAVGGGLLGAGLGGLIGSYSGNAGAGAAIGGAGGALLGGLVGNDIDKQERRQEKAALAAAYHQPLGLGDIVKLTQDHVSDSVIIAQMQATGSVYNLTANDITYLRQQGVSEQVIVTMINRRPGTVAVPATRREVIYVAEPPPTVGIGFGYTYGPRYRRW